MSKILCGLLIFLLALFIVGYPLAYSPSSASTSNDIDRISGNKDLSIDEMANLLGGWTSIRSAHKGYGMSMDALPGVVIMIPSIVKIVLELNSNTTIVDLQRLKIV